MTWRRMIGISKRLHCISRTCATSSLILIPLLFCGHTLAADYGEINVTNDNCVAWSTNLSDNVGIITGNIVVTSGELNLSNATIKMNCTGNGQYKIDVKDGGALNLANNSLVTANNANYRYNWWYRSGSDGSLTESTIEYCGYNVGSCGLKIETDGMTIDSCTIRYTYYGIFLSSSDNTVITNTTANENTKYGIYLSLSHNNNITGCTANSNGYAVGYNYYGSGICLENSNNNTLSGNTANSNKQYGIYTGSCSNNTLANNTASSNSYYHATIYDGTGIYLSSDSKSTLFNNTVSNNGRYGICLDSSEDCDLQNNNMTENTCYGLYVTSKYNSEIDQSNTVNGNKVHYYYNNNDINIETDDAGHITLANCTRFNITDNVIDDGDGIRIIGSSNITISNNTLLNNYHGIELSNSSYNNLTDNNASSNDHNGIYLISSESNNLTDNNAGNNDHNGIYLISSESNNLTNNTADANTNSGFHLLSSHSNDLSNNTASSNSKGVYLESSESNNITNSTLSDNVYGYYIESSSNNTLTNNSMTGNTDSGLCILNNYDNAIDPYSNTVDGEPVYYYYNYTSVEIKNNSLNAYNVSNLGRISLINCSGFVIKNNTIKNRYHGIYMQSSDNISIIENDLTVIGENGVHITSSNNNTLHGITASNCNSHGIYMFSCINNTISDCITNSNERGIYLGVSDYNTFVNNTACFSTDYGFYLTESDYNTFVNNTACFSTNYYGVYLQSSDHINFSDGNVSNNGGHGFQIDISSNYTTIVNTSVCSNGDRGIMLESDHNNISDNNISYNGGNGLHLAYSDYNEIDGNAISNNSGRGIVFAASNNNDVTWNNILNNSDNGVRFRASSRFNELIANTIAGNGVYDVYILSSNNNTITQTKAQLDKDDFYFDGDTDACIFDTIFDDTRYNLTESANLTVRWYLDVWVTDSLYIKNIAGSSVTLRYNETGGNATIFSGMVGQDGRLSSYYDTLPDVTGFNASPGTRTDYGLYANATTATNQTGYNDTDYQVTGQGATLIITTGWTVNTRCYYCHEDKKAFELTQHANDTIGSDARNCTYCHNATDTEAIPHGRSSGPDLLAAPSPRLCYNGSDGASGGSCHGVGSPYGDQYTEFRSMSVHPVNDGNMSCATCHDNHGFSAEYIGSMEEGGEEYRTADYDLKRYYYTGSDTLSSVFGGYFSEEFDLCYTCHLEEDILNMTAQKTNFWESGGSILMEPNYHQGHISWSDGGLFPGCRCCHNPHGSDIPRMTRNQSLISSTTGGFFGFINNSAYLLNEANGYTIPDDWYNESLNRGGAITNDPDDYGSCCGCHSAGSEPYNPSAWGSYARDLLPITPTGGPNCTECHDNAYPNAIRPMVNVTAMNLGMHAGVNSDCNITYWAAIIGFNASNVSEDNKICWGCHATNGTPPYPDYHPDRTLNPYKCAKCHGEYQPQHVNVSDPDITHNATIIKNHGPTTKGGGSIRIQTDLGKGGSCEDCHYPSRLTDIGELKTKYCTNDGIWHWKTYNDTTILGNSSHYGLNSTGGMLMTPADNSTSCIYCHCNETNSILWGNASIVDMETHSGGVASNRECYGCHVIGNHPDDPVEDLVIPGNFHNETLYSGGGPDCIVCHDVGNVYGFTETNITSVNLGIHRNVTKNAYAPIDVDDRSKPCWGCHQSDGYQPDGMGDIYDNPWRCEDCHTPSVAWKTATNNGYTWSADGSPLPPSGIVEHAPNSTDVRTNVTGNGTCVDCHNNSIDPYHNDTDARLLGSTIDANISHYGRSVSLDTLDCMYCHNGTGGTEWGGATQIYIGGSADMYDATENTECYACHIDYGVAMPDDFHKNSLNWGGSPNCTSCHDTSSDACFNAGFGVDSGVNVTSVASTSVHRNVNQNATDPGNTWAQEDWSGGVGSATNQYNASLNTSASGELRLDTVPCEENDTFTDESEITSYHTVTISGGDVNLSVGNITGNLTSTVIAPGKLGGWGIFHANDTLNWGYKRAVTIENTAGPLTDHQVRIDVSYYSDMKSDFSDIRFTDSGGATLHYWIEEYTSSTSAVVWVRIPSISSQKTIYMHYGNPSAVSKSSIHDTFLFGDDFENATLTNASINKFTYPSKQYVENGMYHISGLAGEEMIAEINSTQFPDDYLVEVVVRWIDDTNGSICINPRYHDADNRYVSSFNDSNVSISKVVSGVRSNLAIDGLDMSIFPDAGYTFITAIRDTTATNEITLSTKLAVATVGYVQTTDNALDYENLAFSGTGSDTFHIHLDDLRVRRYSGTEPITSIGAEEVGDEIIYEILDSSNNTILSVSDGSCLSSIDADAIRIKATLETMNASFTPTLHDWNVTWYYYKIEGNLTSAAHSTGENYNFSTISWTGQVPDDTGVRFRLRSGDTESALYAAAWHGPGTGDYYTASGTEINPTHDDDQWIQYRAYLNATHENHTPTLYDIAITYTTSYHQHYPFDPRNKICWACHDTDGAYVGAMGDRYDQPWDCSDCHIQYGTRWNIWTDVTTSPPLVVEHQPDAPAVQTNVFGGTCADCHNNSIDQYHGDTREAIIGNTLPAIVSHYALNKSFGRLLTASNNTTDCLYCHYTDDTTASKWGNATNITLGQNFVHGTDLASDIYTNNSRCYECHVTTKEIPGKPYFHSETLLLGGGPDCISCHDTGRNATNINATSIGSGMHGGLSDLGVTLYQQSVSCWACHGDGTEPAGHPENVRDPLYCGYCHADSSGYAYASLFGSPPRVYDHIPKPYAQDVRTNISGSPNGTCEYCHNNSIDPYHNDTDELLIGNTMLANVSHYGWDKTSGMLMTAANNTTDCLYCHNNTPNNITWGSAKIMTHKQDYNNADCYGCHDTTGMMPATFHAERMSSGGGGDCIKCHDIGGSAEHRINVTAVNSGVHASINNNASNSTLIPASNKKCWGCHQSDGTEPTTDMGDIVSTPYQCRDCHNGTVPHINLSTATGVHEHFKSGAEIQALQNEDNNTESCLACHNMSEMKVNYAEDDSYGNTISFVSHYARNYTELASMRDLTNSTTYCQYCHDNSSVIFDPFIDSSCQNITHGSNCSACHGAGKIHDAELGSGGGPDCLRCHGGDGIASSRRIDGTVFGGAIHGRVNDAASDLNRSCWVCHFENGTNTSEHSMRKTQPYLCYDCHNKNATPLFSNVSGAPNAHNHFKSGTSVEAYRDEATDSESCMRCHNQSEMFYAFDENDTYATNFSITSHYGNNRTDIVDLYNETDYSNEYCQYCHRNSSTPFIERSPLKNINHHGSASCDECHGKGRLHNGTLTRVSTAGNCTECHALYGNAQPGMNYKINVTAMNLGVHADMNENMTATAAAAPINDSNNAKCWGCHVPDGGYPEDGHKGTFNNDAYLCYDCHNGTAAYQNVSSATEVYNHFKSGNISACTVAETDSESCGYGCHNLTSMKVPGFEGIAGKSGYRENMSQASHYAMNRSDDIVLADDLSDCAWCHKDSENEFIDIFERAGTENISHASKTTSCIVAGCHNRGRIHDMSLSRGDAGPDCLKCHSRAGLAISRRIDETAFATSIHGDLNNATNESDLNRSCWVCHFENGLNADNHTSKKSTPYLCYDCHNKVGAPFANVSAAPNAYNHFKSGTNISAYWNEATDSESCMGCHNQSEMNYAFNENDTYATNFSITSHYGNNRTDLVARYDASNNTEYCAYCHINESSPFFEYPNNRDIQHTGTQNCDDCHGTGRLHNDSLTRVTTTANCTDCHALYGANKTQTRYHINVSAVNIGVHADVNENMNATAEAEVADVNNAKCWGCHVPNGAYPADGHGDIFNNDAYLCYECHNGTPAYGNVSSATAVYNHYKSGTKIRTRTVAKTDSFSCGYGCHNLTTMKVPDFNAGENATYRVNMSQASHYTRDRPDIANVSGGYSDCGWCHLDSSNEFIDIFERAGAPNYTENIQHASATSSCIVEGCHNKGRIHDLNLTFPDWDIGRECANCHLTGGVNASGIVAIINKIGFNASVHRNITGDYNSSNYTAISRVCWGCHNNYTEQAADPKSHAKIKPNCEDCHDSASPQNMGNLNESLRQVTEHQPNGTDISTNAAIANCTICHNRSLVTGMPPNEKVVSRTPRNAISHYGRQRTDMIEGAVTNCSYCHCNETNMFADTFDCANNTNITHGGSSTGCTGCHGDGRFHDAALSSPMMTPGNNSLCMNTACHGNNQKSWFVDDAAFTTRIHGAINCTDCHAPLPVSVGGSVGAGGTYSRSFIVPDDVKLLNVTLNWTAGSLNLALDANGTEINQTVAAGNSSIDYDESGTFIRYTVTNPAGGSWVACISNVSTQTSFNLDIEFILKHPKSGECFANPCESCHVTDVSYNAPPVAEHITSGTASSAGVWTNVSCAACHDNDITLLSLGGGVDTSNQDAMTAHYGSHLSFDTAECNSCHEDDDISAKWGDANDPRNFTRHETVREVLRTGKVWKLKNEYEIVVGPVSSSGSSIRVNLAHHGVVVKDELVTVGDNFEYEVKGLAESGDMAICNLTVSNIFAAGLWGVVTFDGTVLASRIHIETENADCYACHISGYRYGAEDGDEYLVLRNDGEDVTIGMLPVNFTERERRIQGVGHVWDLGHEYTLTVTEVDLLGGKARLELARNETVLESKIVEEGGVFMYNTTIRDRKGHVINDVTVFQVRVGRVFRR